MNRLIQLAAIGLVPGITHVASAHDNASTQPAHTTPAATVNKEVGVPAGTALRGPAMVVKRNSQLTKHSEGSVQTDTDTYTTATEFVHVTTMFAYDLDGKLVDMKISELRRPRS